MRPYFFAVLFTVAPVKANHHRDVPHKLKESIHGPPHGWVRHGLAPPDHLLRLKIALPQPHFPVLEQHLWEVSDPSHERYGAYLSKVETDALMAPHPESLDAVSAWLSSYGIKEENLHRSSAQDWVTVRVPVALAEEMLNTKYHVYTHADSSKSIVRTTNYSLPEDLHEHVELIQPTTMFAGLNIKSHWSNPTQLSASSPSNGSIIGPAGNQVDASCNETTTITCLRQLYNVAGYKSSATNINKIALAVYFNSSANYNDLQKFYQEENPEAYGSNYTFVSINGGFNNQTVEGASVEASLDAQFGFGMSHPTPGFVFSTGLLPGEIVPFIPSEDWPKNDNWPFGDFLEYMLSRVDLPQTISTSYGGDEQILPLAYATRFCGELAALGARGATVLFSSGDGGVGNFITTDPSEQHCRTNDGRNKTMFITQFPASCPYVTSVGGTMYVPEIGGYFSGGGFSSFFRRPDYQNAFVNKYLEKLTPGTYDGLYDPNGRGIPDVAAIGYACVIVYQGEHIWIEGTSCSVPIFSAIVSMLNDARINAGIHPLGFMNPWLYQKGHTGLNDITMGNNPGCGTQGFNASVGWDPVTGLGTPNLQKLLALATNNHY